MYGLNYPYHVTFRPFVTGIVAHEDRSLHSRNYPAKKMLIIQATIDQIDNKIRYIDENGSRHIDGH